MSTMAPIAPKAPRRRSPAKPERPRSRPLARSTPGPITDSTAGLATKPAATEPAGPPIPAEKPRSSLPVALVWFIIPLVILLVMQKLS